MAYNKLQHNPTICPVVSLVYGSKRGSSIIDNHDLTEYQYFTGASFNIRREMAEAISRLIFKEISIIPRHSGYLRTLTFLIIIIALHDSRHFGITCGLKHETSLYLWLLRRIVITVILEFIYWLLITGRSR